MAPRKRMCPGSSRRRSALPNSDAEAMLHRGGGGGALTYNGSIGMCGP